MLLLLCHHHSTHLNSLFSPLYAVRVVLQIVFNGRGQSGHKGGLEFRQVLLYLLVLWIDISSSAAGLVTIDALRGRRMAQTTVDDIITL